MFIIIIIAIDKLMITTARKFNSYYYLAIQKIAHIGQLFYDMTPGYEYIKVRQ